MPRFLEKKLKARYGKDSATPYKIMNKLGVMHGNKETLKGKNMEKKHEINSPIKGLSSERATEKKKKKKENHYDPFARAMNK